MGISSSVSLSESLPASLSAPGPQSSKGSWGFRVSPGFRASPGLSDSRLRVLILSADDRTSAMIDYHLVNVREYCDKWGLDHVFIPSAEPGVPIHWSKLFRILRYLKGNTHDYVLWMDTDAVFVNTGFDIEKLLTGEDIVIGHDVGSTTLCAGVFAIKNSAAGIKFIEDCIKDLTTNCVDSKGQYYQGPVWAKECYDQGTMNVLLKSAYAKNVRVVGQDLIKNTPFCDVTFTFILHKFGPKTGTTGCFEKIGGIRDPGTNSYSMLKNYATKGFD